MATALVSQPVSLREKSPPSAPAPAAGAAATAHSSPPSAGTVLLAVAEVSLLVLITIPLTIVVPLRILGRLAAHRAEDLVKPDAARRARFPTLPSPLALSHPSLAEPAIVVAAKIRAGEYSSIECVEASIAHAAGANAHLNFIARSRADEARSEARRADAALADDRAAPDAAARLRARALSQPFFGVPCSVKESFAVAGFPGQTSGIRSRKGIVPAADATAVARMREAGLIIIHSTTTSELCMWYESSTVLFGRTLNPYCARRIVGGSSGGEACAVSAGSVCVGLGADIGGSLRMPAFFCGTFAHKPSGGVVASTGQHPLSPYRFLGTGPITRYSADLLPMLSLMAGDDGVDPACIGTPREIAAPPAWKDVTVLTVPWASLDATRPGGLLGSRVENAIRSAVDRAAWGIVRATGCKGPEHFVFAEFAEAFDLWAAALSEAPLQPQFAHLMGEAHGMSDPTQRWWLFAELIRYCVGVSETTLPAAILGIIEHLPKTLAPGRHRALVEAGLRLRDRLNSDLRNAILVFPPHPLAAPTHDIPLLLPINIGYTSIFNVTELPATSVPMGLDVSGIPVGCQLVSAHGNDRLTIAAAVALEDAGIAGWTPPPMLGTSWAPRGGVGATGLSSNEALQMAAAVAEKKKAAEEGADEADASKLVVEWSASTSEGSGSTSGRKRTGSVAI